ncbi:MAG: hypothetical protein ACKPER_00720, partial [Dolichospermum sp.]
AKPNLVNEVLPSNLESLIAKNIKYGYVEAIIPNAIVIKLSETVKGVISKNKLPTEIQDTIHENFTKNRTIKVMINKVKQYGLL